MRLGKQRVECLQILKALTLPNYGWKNHPATKMWKGYEQALVWYGVEICEEWRNREYKDTILDILLDQFDTGGWHPTNPPPLPPWIGDEDFHNSHKSNLLRKFPKYYSQFNWQVPDNLPYIWPTN